MGWNLARLADALRLVAPGGALGGPLSLYEARYEDALTRRTLARLGVRPRDPATDGALARAALAFLDSSGAPFERFFFDVRAGRLEDLRAEHEGPRWDELASVLSLFEAAAARPEVSRPCTVLIDEVEAIWSAIAERDDWSPFEAKVREVRAYGASLSFTSP